jgi:hypothetical protein
MFSEQQNHNLFSDFVEFSKNFSHTLCPQSTGFGCNNRRMFSVNFRTKILLCWVRPHKIIFYILILLSVKIWGKADIYINDSLNSLKMKLY